MWETPTEVVYAVDLPGVPEADIAIEVKDDTLTASAERTKTEEANDNGQGVDQGHISARYENGVLEIRVPKPEEQKPKKIELSKTFDA